MIHTMLESIHDSDAHYRGGRIDAHTVTTQQKKFVSLSSTLSKDQLRKRLHIGTLRLPANVGYTLLFVGVTLLLGYLSYWFFSGIRQDYGPVVVAKSNCQLKEFWSHSDNRPPEPWHMEVCDYIYEDKIYTDAGTVMKWAVRGSFGCMLAWFALLAAKAAYYRFAATVKNIRAYRSPEPSDIVREFELEGYQWDMLKTSFTEEHARYDSSCFDSADEAWDLFIESLTKGDELGVKLDEPTSKYLVATSDLAVAEKHDKPLKDERDKAVSRKADLASIKIFRLLVESVTAKRANEHKLANAKATPDHEFLKEVTRDNEQRNVAALIAAADEVVI